MGRQKRLLIVKTGAAGDVVRTTTLLHLFYEWEVDWLTARENCDLLQNSRIRYLMDDPKQLGANASYDLVICLEDDAAYVKEVCTRITFTEIFGSYTDLGGDIRYTENAAEWFDMSLSSRMGKQQADALKLRNRSSYQEIVFRCLGHVFAGEEYVMPERIPDTGLQGEIAISPKAGARWPIKNWHHFDRIIRDLSERYVVNVLPMRSSLLEHIGDIRGHKFLIAPDSLPMHIALGLRIPSVAIFTCTSPWEIYDYGRLTKIISPTLEKYFYSRKFVLDAVASLPYEEAYTIIVNKLKEIGI